MQLAIYPIRLHIEQESLDFLIHFFHEERLQEGDITLTEDETYFQSVQIAPIVFKVDYKPKAVDVQNLASGKYVELLQFFALDDVKLTLDAVKLSGVNS